MVREGAGMERANGREGVEKRENRQRTDMLLSLRVNNRACFTVLRCLRSGHGRPLDVCVVCNIWVRVGLGFVALVH